MSIDQFGREQPPAAPRIPDAPEETQASEEKLRAEIARGEARAARFGTAGRILCALAVVALCVCLGIGRRAPIVAAGVVTGAVVVGYLVAVMAVTRRLDGLRARLPAPPPSPLFAELEADFDATELSAFTARVPAREVRVFRDPDVLEAQFTFERNLVVSCEFDRREARLIVNFRTETPYRLAYAQCETADALYRALLAKMEELL